MMRAGKQRGAPKVASDRRPKEKKDRPRKVLKRERRRKKTKSTPGLPFGACATGGKTLWGGGNNSLTGGLFPLQKRNKRKGSPITYLQERNSLFYPGGGL